MKTDWHPTGLSAQVNKISVRVCDVKILHSQDMVKVFLEAKVPFWIAVIFLGLKDNLKRNVYAKV